MLGVDKVGEIERFEVKVMELKLLSRVPAFEKTNGHISWIRNVGLKA